MLNRMKLRYDDWQLRRSIQKRLEVLVNSITQQYQSLKERDDLCATVALRHVERADRNYKHALEHYMEEDFDQCDEFLEKGELHLHFAHLQMVPNDADYQSDFAEGSLYCLLESFCEAITQTKMAIEYNNCVLSDQDRKDLVSVAVLFNQALKAANQSETESATSTAEGGLLLLHATVININVDNHERLAEIRLPKKAGSKASLKAKELADYIHDCKQRFEVDGAFVSETARSHLGNAERNLRVSIQRLIEQDEQGCETAASGGMLEAKFAERMVEKTAQTAPIAASARVEDFAHLLSRLKKLLKRTKTHQHDSAEKHLAACHRYFSDAISEAARNNLSEASRLARAAYLDLDFARQLIVSKEPPQYLDV